MLVLDIATSALIDEQKRNAKGRLSAGSSKLGKARRASVDSNCVTA